MSYTIMYRSMFVKLSDGRFIPMVEMGDNNVRDWNGRRSRSWQQWVIGKSFKTFPAYTKDEIMAEVECVINNEKKRVGQPYADYEHKEGVYTEQEIEQHWGYYSCIAISGRHCNTTTAQQFRNFFLKGFEQAVTFDEDVTIDLHWCTEYPNWEHRYVHSEQELRQTWEELKSEKRSIWLAYSGCADRLYEEHRRKVAPRVKKEHTAGFVVKIGYRYVTKMTSRHLWHNHWFDEAKIYSTRAAAEKVARRITQYYTTITDVPQVLPARKNETGKWELAA